MDFVAIDVETANADMSSICQVGIALFRDFELTEEWKSYIDPDDYFDPVNISIHGIDESVVRNAPSMESSHEKICRYLDGSVVVCHTHFDRISIRQSFTKNGLREPSCQWIDSARVARRTWTEFAQRGYGLRNLCEYLDYEFLHHDALEDAKASAHVLMSAIRETGLDLDGWMKRVERPIGAGNDGSGAAITRVGVSDGPLFGDVVVFTGTLQILRREAADMAARAGCHVDGNVTKKTTILVVGDQDVVKLAGHEISSKHRKTEKLIAKGQPIRILRETDFRELVGAED